MLVTTASFLTAFEFFVVNVALPSMRADLGARPAQLEFVVAGYGLAAFVAGCGPDVMAIGLKRGR